MIFAANLSRYEKLLQQKYEVSTSIWHKGERGRQRENGLAMFLRETLPAAYGVATGEIFPHIGERPSPQCDIIIYDRLRTLAFGLNDVVQQVPLEGVYAVIETKSTIDSKGIADARKKFSKIRSLPRCRNKIPLKDGFRRGPVFYLFGYKLTASVRTCVKLMQEHVDTTDVSVVALSKGLGIYIGGDTPKPVWLETSSAEASLNETLMFFLVSLLGELESIDLGAPDLLEWLTDK